MNSIKKNYFYNTLLQIMMLIVPVVTTPYLSRTIGAEGIGTYAYHYAIASYYILFIKLGIDTYGNRAVAECRNNQNKLDEVFSELVYLQFILGIIVSLIYLLYSCYLSSQHEYALLFFLTILATCLDVNWFLYGMEKFKAVSLVNACVKTLSTVLIFIFINNEEHIFRYCVILNACTLISQVVAWPLVLRNVKFIKVNLNHVLKHLMPNMILFISLVSVCAFKTMDKIMLGVMSYNKLDLGFYELSERIIAIPNMLITSLGMVMMPRIANMVVSNDDGYKRHIFISMIFSMIVASSMSFGIMGVSKEFVPLFYGEGFEKCIYLYLILLPCSIFMSFATVVRTQYLVPNHRDKALLVASVIGVLLNLIVNLMLIPIWGAIGAAIATLASEIIVCVYQVSTVRKELDINRYFKYSFIIVMVGVGMFMAIFYLNLSMISNTFFQILIKMAVGGIIFILGIIIVFMFEKKQDQEITLMINSLQDILLAFKRKKRDIQ